MCYWHFTMFCKDKAENVRASENYLHVCRLKDCAYFFSQITTYNLPQLEDKRIPPKTKMELTLGKYKKILC